MGLKGCTRRGHTSCRRGKRVIVKMMNGETFIDKFVEATPKWMILEKRGKIEKICVKSFAIYKPLI
jgi:hypothetical protein